MGSSSRGYPRSLCRSPGAGRDKDLEWSSSGLCRWRNSYIDDGLIVVMEIDNHVQKRAPPLVGGATGRACDVSILRSKIIVFAEKMKFLLSSVLFSGVLLSSLTSSTSLPENDPSPNPKSVVQVGKARFTVLTNHLIRMEWGGSIDAATFAFINRNLPTPVFNVSKDGNWTIIQTPAVKVRYLPSDDTFSADNLMASIELNGKTVTWQPNPTGNATLEGNLLGTVRTLDGANGSIELNCYKQYRGDLHCQLGLVSTQGYVVVDDTNHPQFDNSQWPWVVNQTFPQPQPDSCAKVERENRRDCGFPGISDFDCIGKGCCLEKGSNGIPMCYYGIDSYQDLYFFGHGHDYKFALKEFTLVSGKIPLPPRYAFGIFYSRYWAYDDIGDMEIVGGYEQRSIPLDVLVTDMDWHITFYKEANEGKKDQAGETIGWTGFTWDNHLFPDPKAFLDWCQEKGIKNTLNLHPASGMQPWEEKYSEMAVAMGIDPKTNKYVPFVPSDLKFMTNWLTIVLGEREKEGIDFWWLDWQQGEAWIKIPLVNPTFWLNYVFFTTPYQWKNNTVRPFLLHRWGGLGNHRYQVGFSGDVVPSWASLHFQVYFTLRATNVGFGYWSHDLGGHLGISPPELYTRWVQWGAFSPMFRTHCTKNPLVDRRIWVYPPVNYKIMRQAMRLRASLIPYIYSNARYAYDEGLSLLRPMYYEFPEAPESYTFDRQYFFGSDILAAPVTQPVSETTGLATKEIWIPKGTYISWFTGELLTGPQTITRNFTLSEIPVYIRAGTIIPLRTDDFGPLGSAQEIPSELKLMLFIGNAEEGSLHLYEDDGVTNGYISGEFANTSVSYKIDSSSSMLSVTVGPTKGNFSSLPSARAYQIHVPNFWPADKVTLAGKELPYVALRDSFDDYSMDSWTYDGRTLSLIINILTKQPVSSPVLVVASYGSYTALKPYTFYPGYVGLLGRLQQAKQLLDMQWNVDIVYQEDYFALLNATETGRRITYNPTNIITYTEDFGEYMKNAVQEVEALKNLKDSVKGEVLSLLSI